MLGKPNLYPKKIMTKITSTTSKHFRKRLKLAVSKLFYGFYLKSSKNCVLKHDFSAEDVGIRKDTKFKYFGHYLPEPLLLFQMYISISA